MRTELDEAMDATLAALTAPGGPMQLAEVALGGRSLPVIAGAPPTLPAYFAHFCGVHGAADFLVADPERLSFAAVHALSLRVARALVAGYGIRPGDRVGIAMRNSPAWILLYMGIVSAGGIACLLNGWWQGGELARAIDDVDAGLVFVDGPRALRLGDQPTGATLVTLNDTLPIERALAPVLAWDADGAALPAVAPEDPATILFTSGSTGTSKGALSDHRAVVQATFNFLSSAMTMLGIATRMGHPPQGQPATLLNLPLFHVTAEVAVLLQSFAMGRKLVLMTRWDAREAMRLIEAERVTYFVGVPLMSFEILTHPDRARFDLSSVTDFAAGGAARPADHVRRIHEEMAGPDGRGGAPLIGYGLTETNAVGTGNWRTNYLAKPDSAGRPSPPLVELAIVDEAGTAMAQGDHGEVAIRSVANFREYWRDPAATARCFTPDGFFRTGDIGYLDADGYLFIVDRSKDIIIRGGENISCQEVEAALYEHPAVAEAAVFGLTEERLGEVPAAVVVLREGAGVDADALGAFLGTHLAAFKVPARIWLSATALPRLGTEKIDKVAIRTRYRALAASPP